MEAIMGANLSAHAITTTIATGQELLLYRTLDLPEDFAHRVAEIQRGIAVASAYFEDKLGSRPRTLHYAGVQDPAEFAASIGDPELSVVEWAPRPDQGAMTALPQACFAGVAGALAGAS
jgi:type IV pilus assembly protein PilM